MCPIHVSLDWDKFCFRFVELLFRTAENNGEALLPHKSFTLMQWYHLRLCGSVVNLCISYPHHHLDGLVYHLFFAYREIWNDRFSGIL